MAHLDIDTVLGWQGRTVRDDHGEKIGALGDVFLDRETDRPAWAGVRTGLFGRKETYVPLDEVLEGEDGDLRVPFSHEQVKGAPQIDPDVTLTEEEEQALFVHYGRAYAPSSENEMIRSEEEVRVDDGPMRPAERVRLRKVLVTEHESRTVPVQREVVQLESEPPPPGRIDSVEDVDDPSSDPSAPR